MRGRQHKFFFARTMNIMEELIFGENYYCLYLPGTNFDNLESRLIEWFRKHSSLQWENTTIVFVTILAGQNRRDVLQTETILRFGAGKGTIDQSQYALKECLLFVELSEYEEQLFVFGGLRYDEYMSMLSSNNYITLGNLKPIQHLITTQSNTVNALETYWFSRTKDTTTPKIKWEMALNTLFTQIMGLQTLPYDQYQKRLAAHGSLLGKVYPFALFLASCEPMLKKQLLDTEVGFLKWRLGQLTTESLKIAFLCKWFENGVDFSLSSFGFSQYAHCPKPVNLVSMGLGRMTNDVLEFSRLQFDWLRKRHAHMYPETAFPSAILSGNAEFLSTQSYCDLQVFEGEALFTLRELDEYLCTMLRCKLSREIDTIGLQAKSYFASSVWCRVKRYSHCGFVHYVREDIEVISKSIPHPMLEEAMRARSEFTIATAENEMAQDLLETTLLPILNERTENWNSYFGWNFDAGYEPSRTVCSPASFDPNNSSAPGIPISQIELANYAHEFWAPCVCGIVDACLEGRHMKYLVRLKMVAFLRMFGYTLEEAKQLWFLMFSGTDVLDRAVSMDEFYDSPISSKYSQFLVYSFEQNRRTNLGISCMTLISKGYCEFTESVRDIEELDLEARCRKKCTEHINTIRQTPTQYAVQSPIHFWKIQSKNR